MSPSAGSTAQDHYWFSPNNFAPEAFGTFGNAGRNFFHGPGINNFTFAMYKDTRITESTRIELRFEFFNFFNHTQFSKRPTVGGVDGNLNDGNFGRIINADSPRLIQLGAKFYF